MTFNAPRLDFEIELFNLIENSLIYMNGYNNLERLNVALQHQTIIVSLSAVTVLG